MRVQVFCDADADGISACILLLRAIGKDAHVKITPVNSADEKSILREKIIADRYYFLDVGATIMDFIEKNFGRRAIVIDHHLGSEGVWNVGDYVNPVLRGRGSLDYASTSTLVYDYFGLDSDYDAFLALTGAFGDIEDVDGELWGLNRKVLDGSGLEVLDELKVGGKLFAPLSLVLDVNLFPPVYLDFDEIVSRLGKFAFSNYFDVKEKVDPVLAEMYGKNRPIAYYPSVWHGVCGERMEAHDLAVLLNTLSPAEIPEFVRNVASGHWSLQFLKIRALEDFSSFERMIRSVSLVKKGDLSYALLDGVPRSVLGQMASYFLIKKKSRVVAVCTRDADEVFCSLKSYDLNVEEITKIAAFIAGGKGGGHSVAAGARVPLNAFKYFIKELHNQIKP